MKKFSAITILSLLISSGCSHLVPAIGLQPGRPLRIDGEPISANIGSEGSQWAQGERPDVSQLDLPTQKALAALWLEDARGEHASIPAFSNISWQLTKLGAPSELIEQAHKAALEEIGHARLCFALAEGYGNQPYFVQPIPEMHSGDESFETFVQETIVDGCLVEGFFTQLATQAAATCEDPAVQAALTQISLEEQSHAAFSWEMLTWLCQARPTEMKDLIQNALVELKNYPQPTPYRKEIRSLVAKADPELLRKHGRVPEEEWQKVWEQHLADTIGQLQSF